MSNNGDGAATQCNLDDMQYYVVIGRHTNGEDIIAASPNIKVLDMGAMIGRLQAMFQIQLTQAPRTAKQSTGRLVRPQ